MYCKKCGKEIPEGSKFCLECGAPVAQDAPAKNPVPMGLKAAIIILSIVMVCTLAALIWTFTGPHGPVIKAPEELAYKATEVQAESAPAVVPGSMVLLDDCGVKVTYLGLEDDDLMKDQFRLLIRIENNLDSEVSVRQDSTSVNGKMVTSVLGSGCSVAPGKYSEGWFYVDGHAGDVEDITTKLCVHYGIDRDFQTICETDYITIEP